MKKLIWIAVACVVLYGSSVSQALAVGVGNCTVNNTASNSSGTTWINVTCTTGGGPFNLIFPTAASNTFLATALTALSSGKLVNMDVTVAADWGSVNAINVSN